MNNTDRLAKTGSFLSIAAAMLFLAIGAAAQGRYASRYSKGDVNKIVAKVEQSSDAFRRDFKRALNNSKIDGSSSEDRYNNLVRDFENSVDRLRRDFDRSDSWWQTRNRVQDIIGSARPVNTMVTGLSFRRNIERQWTQLRSDINDLADTYDLPGLNGGGWNGGGGNGDIGNGSVPNWAVGTFYGRNPRYGRTITLTINRNGRVVADVEGSRSNGTLNGNNLNMDGARARITQINNGIRTRGSNGEVIDYYRSNGNGNGGGGDSGGNVPNWAVGTFYASNPETGGRMLMTIKANGQVSVNFGWGTDPAYGTLYGTTLTIGNKTSTIKKRGKGFRSTRTDNGQRIDYSR